MKPLASVLCALAVSLAGAQVTYRTTGATVAKVVAEVAKSTDQKLTVDKDLAKEIVVVSVKDVPLDEFKKRIADCVSGKWVEKEGGVLELNVDATLSAERRKSAQEAYAKSIPGKIKSSFEMFSPEGMGAIRQPTQNTNLLALEIGRRLSESTYESVPPIGRIVFSTNPNRSQRQLPDISDLIAKHIAPANVAGLSEIVFAVERPNFDGFTRFALCGLQGSRAVTFTFISLVSIQKATPPLLTGTQIKWSSLSLELGTLFRNSNYRTTSGLMNLSQATRETLSKPTEIDPMAYGFGEGIMACASETGENVMACIPDDEVHQVFAMGIPGTATGEFWRQIRARDSLVAEQGGGWISLRPTDPVAAREQRGDRVALEKLITKAKGNVWPSLDELSEFAASNLNRRDLPMAFVLPYQALINNYGRVEPTYESNFRPLQLFASLSLSEKQKLRNGERLNFTSLSANAKDVLNAIIFAPSGAVLSFNASSEATELFPSGLGDGFLISAKVTPSVVFAPLLDAGEATMAPAPMSARDIAMNRWSRQQDDNPHAQDTPELSRVLVGAREVWQFSLLKGAEQIGKVSLAGDSIPKDAKPTTIEALPQNVKDLLEKAYKDYVKEMGGGG